jgi:hypothetical protein
MWRHSVVGVRAGEFDSPRQPAFFRAASLSDNIAARDVYLFGRRIICLIAVLFVCSHSRATSLPGMVGLGGGVPQNCFGLIGA